MARDGMLFRRWPGAGIAMFAFAFAWGSVFAAAPTYRGRPVTEVLRQLQDESLQFLYSSDLVKDSSLVRTEPKNRDRLGIAREVLGEYGLQIRSVNPALYIVVRKHQGERLRKIAGRVLDGTSEQALSGVRVELLPLGQVAFSNHSGHFAFDRLAAGEDYRLLASIEGFGQGETRLRLESAGSAAVDCIIQLHRAPLETVVVEASRYALASEAGNEAYTLEAAALANQPDIADDPIRALRRLPGVVQGGISAASNLRGGETNEVLVLLDGFPLRQVYHLPGYQSPFTLVGEDLVASVDVFTGGFPARYGNRLAGVFDIESVETGQAPRTSVGLSFFNAHARHAGESADGDTGWRGAARVGTLRPVLQYLGVDTGRPSYSDLSLKATQRMTDNFDLSANLLWAADEYALADDDEHAEIASRTRYGWLRADYAPSDYLSGSLWVGQSNMVVDRAGDVVKPEFSVGEVSEHRDATIWDARGSLNWQWNERSRLNAGFEWSVGRAAYRYDSEVSFAEPLAELFGRDESATRSLRLAPSQRRAALFVSQRWQLSERWVPELGLRLQDFRAGSIAERTWDPRVGIRWQLRPRTGLRAHWGRFHQADEVHELAVADGVTDFVRAQRSEHLILGIEHRFTNGISVRAEAFRKQQRHPRARFENLTSPIEVFSELAPDRVRVHPEESRLRGIELSAALERESWQGWSSISVARAVDEFGITRVPRGWEQRLAWTGGLDWHRGQWRVGGAATVRSGWPITEVGFNAEGDAMLGARNAERLPTFASLDLRVEYRRPLAVGSIAIALEVSNVTNRRNQCCVDVEVEEIGTPEESIAVEKQFWPRLLPSLGVRWEH